MENTHEDNLIPVIVTWIDEHGSYVTKTKLLKLLYLFDVEYYRSHHCTFTGYTWKFFHLGPWAAEYDPALQRLLTHGLLTESRSISSEYDAVFFKPGVHIETRRAFTSVEDEYILLGILNRWGTRSTGEILNYVYFQTEPMEAAIRNQPLDFSLILANCPAVYSRSSSGRTPADIRRLRAEFQRRQAEKRAKDLRPFTFTRPKYDDEYFEAMAKLETV